ncbi:iron chelate uptake ABC transporter family permease subunit [Corynebacterium uberis]|uniref:iron chelate uptake ABC transporter family permease subunit n=1 Tax=Corynebacterium TaxID=1716 RepID=UPI001D09DFAF|nr:iron chelate uptake ABC transporter family permease subunit [Corynebacterium uberis]MCZ9309183.1 iron chelate uptake ABC transporter family permease subunit [Corynebacterium sp. c6VSa_13]UDL72745.1 iron chelate uptake ABC transporter family permease subunit [Corynebacterium uberis]UDL76378.1 iron chelate uptake ABC transporter family permease subunit [Corynebacterium uberis]UDL78590.1 iron chelate uptake ABC transporter family permease subunit [Corynebacterium uberis]UDL80871.1 iron chelate
MASNSLIDAAPHRHAGAFPTAAQRRRYWIILVAVILIGAASAWGLIAYGNPMPVGSEVFWLIAQRRVVAVATMAIVATCQAIATVAFQTVTGNRILTPSIMGFEALYVTINTAVVFFLGASGLVRMDHLGMFLVQVALMVGLSLCLYSWLLGGSGDMHAMLLIGIVIGGGLGSLSTFMRRLLTPNEFDVLTARMFGSVNNADPQYFGVAIPLMVGAAAVILFFSRRLNVIALGRDVAMSVGLSYRGVVLTTLVCVSILMAVSTALVGPMTFLGFLVATLGYQCAATYDHAYVLPMAWAIAFAVLTGAYFLMNHVFYAQGVVSVLIELVGGAVFLIVIVRKGRL